MEYVQKFYFVIISFVSKLKLIYFPSSNLVGREELYTQMSFFVQSILADRYIYRGELWVV